MPTVDLESTKCEEPVHRKYLCSPMTGLGAFVLAIGCVFGAIYFSWLREIHRNCADLRDQGFRVESESRISLGYHSTDSILDVYLPTSAFVRMTTIAEPLRLLDSRQTRSLEVLAPLIDDVNYSSLMVDDGTVRVFSKMPQLKRLCVSAERLTDPGMTSLRQMVQLERLEMYCPKVTDQGIRWIETCTHLSSLYLGDSQIGDDGVAMISRCKELVFLRLSGTQVTSRGIRDIAKLPRLYLLDLQGTRIDESAAIEIRKLKSVKHINLSDTDVGDEVCRAIADLPFIEHVDLYQTHVTEDGLSIIRRKVRELKPLTATGRDGK